MFLFVRYLIRGFKWQLILIILIGLLSVASSLSFVWFSKQVVDVATGQESGDWRVYALALLGSVGATVLLRIWYLSTWTSSNVRMGNAIRLRIFSHLLYVRWFQLGKMHSADMLTRLMKDTDEVVQLLTTSIPSILISGVQLLASLVLLYIFSPELALALGLGMPLMIVFSKLFYKRMLSYSTVIKQTESSIYTQMQEALGNQTVVRTFERQEFEIDRLRHKQAQLYQAVRKRVGLTIYGNVMMNSSFSGGYVLAFLWSAYGLMKGTVTFGTMTSFLQLVTRIQRPLSDLVSIVPGMITAKASIDRLVNILEFQTESKDIITIFTGAPVLNIDRVSYKYGSEERWIFRDFSLNVPAGSMLAVMGPTGSGKTTLIRLLLGLISPTQGQITISSSARQVPVSESTRNNFVYVPQGNTLFSGTIRDNLLVGEATADDRRLRLVLDIAEANFVWDLPQGLDTPLGERGLGLSEGQAQRISIARSLLRPGRILLLDEATSALDADTEARFLHNLKKHIDGRIVLFITHHEEVAKHCDQVLRLSAPL